MAILTTPDRTAIALAVAAQPLHLARSTDDPAREGPRLRMPRMAII